MGAAVVKSGAGTHVLPGVTSRWCRVCRAERQHRDGQSRPRCGCAQAMLDVQLASMKGYNPASFGADPSLHFITQRYAQLTTSLLSLNADYQVCCNCCP